MKKAILPLLLFSLIASACADSGGAPETTSAPSSPPTTEIVTTTSIESTTSLAALSAEAKASAQLVVDVDRIEELFRGYSDEWFVSLEAATTYIAENVYQPLGCTPKSALDTFGGVEGQRESIVVLGDTVERADGWMMPIGPSAGEHIEGRVYSFVTETTVSIPGFDDVVTEDAAHATISGDSARFFFQCWEPVRNS